MTRSHKFNDKDHHGGREEHIPKYFAKSGFVDADPTKTKKNGAGRANWYVLSIPQLSRLAVPCVPSHISC